MLDTHTELLAHTPSTHMNDGLPARAAQVAGDAPPRAAARAVADWSGTTSWWCGDWEGYDPTNGVPTGPRHVVVARGRDYSDVPPLRGVYHGAPSSHLGVTVEVTRLG
ncbi:MAG TPA: hypothetical protein VGJ07_20415 [Rugosimonospora sp.]